ncbi:MAG TPA: 2,3-bisphosphoglycerate-independent phosphoglycerate mutase [Bacteroidales bacterium]|nr:2,3-bisphosphoglycerate-independent phosphoglycerate mutase [Bacteroidales bacterium]
MSEKKVLLIILDGWGIGDQSASDIIYHADVPFTRHLSNTVPNTLLRTSGEDVGLPNGQMGNSEVGHLNIGAGRVVYQELVKISKAIKERTFHKEPVVNQAFDYAIKNRKKIHLLGLVSDGGVHSAMDHLFGFCDVAKEKDFDQLYIHAFTDGRDTDPRSGSGFLTDVQKYLETSAGKVASVCGRYYAMDRDKRWERIKLAYDMLLYGKGERFNNLLKAIEASYAAGITDEFITPKVITDNNGKPLAPIIEGDVVICFNFRTDRLREITTVLTQNDMSEYGMKTMPLHYITMTRYDETFKNVQVIYEKDDLSNTLGEELASKGKTQLRIAETEKYPHVTFFFNGGREEPFAGESRIMVPSPKIATYDLQPAMSAIEVKDKVVEAIKSEQFDFICLNFANADMVGHTGFYQAIKEAVETVDLCLKETVEAARSKGYQVIITADHGNADFAVNPDGSPNTAHTTNPVPCWLISSQFESIHPGRLADLAPTILHIMGLPIPEDMTGRVLVKGNTV